MVNKLASEGSASAAPGARRPAPATAWQVAAATPDPELPMLTIADLGILRDVQETADGVIATITPTYSGCPAMREISTDLQHRLRDAGYDDVTVRTRLAPAWTTDWITDDGRRKLAEAGIAPPHAAPHGSVALTLTVHSPVVACPHCGAADTVRTAMFGATACRSLHRCNACREPFEHVKPL